MKNPKITLTLSTILPDGDTEVSISKKLSAPLENAEGVQAEIAHLVSRDAFRDLVEALQGKYGGVELIAENKKKNRETNPLKWRCDGCGLHLPKEECEVIMNENLAGIVLCNDCSNTTSTSAKIRIKK
jgi:hypothetical protein